ncbi:uncharacterized protein F5891DRAFT_1207307 [Suillus fuscotomentosus]|uniref:DUF6532 domain-containing protein n=1 Tax=Suillus fuscotomentosus TaxID=1912939 RepID=A0AAD4EG41_9AGAM|nr:uncharacterized protein F5891DRAFT_1207307 [Suillus fuscotomentosus]KAG1904369.1 hypothetical protein F5891DRAFT_1207307 [Suillus fuscotomentosus]
MPPRASLTPSEIATHKRNSKTKAKASQESGGENQGDTDKPLQRSSKIKALERKVWNETMANSRKRAPTVTGLQSAPAAKLARKIPAKKLDHNNDRGQEAHEVISHAESRGRERSMRSLKSATVSIEDSDTVSEYGESDDASEKSDNDMEVPEDDDFESLSQEELIKEIPHFVRTGSNVSEWMASGTTASVPQVDVADKASDGHSKPYYREATAVTKHQPDKKKDKKKKSKLEERQDLERPKFVETVVPPRPASDVTHVSASESDHSFTWPIFTDLVYSADGSINLKAQNTRIQNVLKAAMFELKKASLFNNAFPNITQKRKMALEAVHTAAGKRKEYVILKRMKHDFDYALALAGIPEGRMSSFRTNLKKLTHQIVYIFPTDAKGKVLGDQPFCDEATIDIIRLSFFDGGEDSFGSQCHDDFVSVLDGNNEPELPVAMVCLTATMIYAILKDWSSGNPPSNAQVKSFNASSHVDVYKAHQATLNHIFNGSIKKYHALMARLYKAVSAIENSASTASSSTCDYLDLDAMVEE